MAAHLWGSRRPFALSPRGQRPSPDLVELAAQAGGYLVGAVVDGTARTWLAESDGHLVLLMWPDGDARRLGHDAALAANPVRATGHSGA